jgi:hypothetical protein
VFDPIDAALRQFVGYGPSVLPNERDDEVSEYVTSLSAILGYGQRIVHDHRKGRDVLRAYPERMASLAVRRREPTVLLAAVIANVVGGRDENRLESLMVMALIEDSARRIDMDLAELFEQASRIVGHPGAVNLMMWLKRKPKDRSLTSMSFVAGEDADGFRYRLDW